MASFDTSYSLVMRHEGGYANVAGDKGGMTYKGIARNFQPGWGGWVIVDEWRASKGGELPRNFTIPDTKLEAAVRGFYQGLWNKSMAGHFRSQDIANLYFDFYVHSAQAVREVQKVLMRNGHAIKVDNAPGWQTINAINGERDQAALHDQIKYARLDYLKAIAAQGSNMQFYQGWLARIMQFPDLSAGQAAGIGAVVLALLVAGLYFIFTQK